MIIHVNKENLKKVREVIVRNAAWFDWSQFMENVKVKAEDIVKKPVCATSCCIAGFAAALSCPPKTKMSDFLEADSWGEVRYTTYERIADEYIHDSNCNDPDAERMKLHEFLYYPWDFVDANGDLIVMADEYDGDREDLLNEALARIDWLLEGKNTDDYVITDEDLIDGFDRF